MPQLLTNYDLIIIPNDHLCEHVNCTSNEVHPTIKIITYSSEVKPYLVFALEQINLIENLDLDTLPVIGLCGFCGYYDSTH